MSTTSVYMKEETASRDRLIKSRDRQLFIVRGRSDLAGDTEVVRDTPADAIEAANDLLAQGCAQVTIESVEMFIRW